MVVTPQPNLTTQRGKVGVENLVNAVPQLKDIANVKGEQVVNIGSQDMNDDVWLTLAKKS